MDRFRASTILGVLTLAYLATGCYNQQTASDTCFPDSQGGQPLSYSESDSYHNDTNSTGILIDDDARASGRLAFRFTNPEPDTSQQFIDIGDLGISMGPAMPASVVRVHLEIYTTDVAVHPAEYASIQVNLTEPLSAGSYILDVCVQETAGMSVGQDPPPETYSESFEISSQESGVAHDVESAE